MSPLNNEGFPGSRAFIESSEVRRRWPEQYMDFLETKIMFEAVTVAPITAIAPGVVNSP